MRQHIVLEMLEPDQASRMQDVVKVLYEICSTL